MYKITLLLFTITLLFTLNIIGVSADSVYVTNSSKLNIVTDYDNYPIDYRVGKLKSFLESYKSPLAPYAYDFVYWADYYNIDWRMVPAITGVESTFGKRIPLNSYNAYGWNNGVYKFTSWEDSIEHVTYTLRTKYKDKGAVTLNQIARRYCPPSNTWAWKVDYFMNKIDPVSLEFDL